jgi:hypothetical protein
MAGLMTVMVIETCKAAVIEEMGSLPGYGSGAHFSSRLVEEGRDIIGDSYNNLISIASYSPSHCLN